MEQAASHDHASLAPASTKDGSSTGEHPPLKEKMHKTVHLERIESIDAPSLGGSIQNEELEPVVGFKTWLVVFACFFAWLAQIWALVAIGLQTRTVVAAVAPTYQGGVWLQNSGTVVATVLLIPVSRVSDFIGRKWIATPLLVIGAVGVFLIGGANSIGMALAGGSLYGFGFAAAAGLLGSTISEVLPRRFRGMAQAIFNLGATIGGMLGATAGQKIATYTSIAGRAGWRWDFWVAGIVGLVGAIILGVCYHPPPVPNPQGRSLTARFLDFDKVGTLLLTVSLVPLLIGLTWGGGEYTWTDPHAIAPTVVGCVLLLVFIAHQTFIKKDGLFHHDLFRHRNYALCAVGCAAEGVFYYTFNQEYGLETGLIYTQDPVQIGIRFACFFYGQYPAYLFVSWFTTKYRIYKWPVVIGFCIFIAAVAGLSQARPDQPNVVIAMAVVAGLGWVPGLTLLFAVAQLFVPPLLIGTATSSLLAIRALFGAVGLAIATSIFSTKAAEAVPRLVVPAVVAAGLPVTSIVPFVTALAELDIAAAEAVPGVTAAVLGAGVAALDQAFSYAFSYIWYFCIAFLSAAAIAAVFIETDIHKASWIVNRPVEAIHHRGGHDNHNNAEKGASSRPALNMSAH